jgi:hypothetical protein
MGDARLSFGTGFIRYWQASQASGFSSEQATACASETGAAAAVVETVV